MDYDNRYDIVTSTFTLSNNYTIEDLMKNLSNVHKALCPGGMFFAVVINGSGMAKLSESDQNERISKLGHIATFENENVKDGDVGTAKFYDEKGNIIKNLQAVNWAGSTLTKCMQLVGFTEAEFTLLDDSFAKEHSDILPDGIPQSEISRLFKLSNYLILQGYKM